MQSTSIENKAVRTIEKTATVESIRPHGPITARDDRTGETVTISRGLISIDEAIAIGARVGYEEALRNGRQITAGRAWKMENKKS